MHSLISSITAFCSILVALRGAQVEGLTVQPIQSSYDFIIVGGGTAGLALANRLSEGNQTVLVLEAGSPPGVIDAYHVPILSGFSQNGQLDWSFVTPAQKTLANRSITYHRGRALGGSSAINGMAYGRGSSSVYDNWASMGNSGWCWEDVFPFFKKSTTFSSPSTNNQNFRTFDASAYSDGPLQIGYPEFTTPASFDFIQSIADLNLTPIVNDLNSGNNIGTKQETLTIDPKMARSSSYDAYYLPVKNRTNLHVVPYALVLQVALAPIANSTTFEAAGVVFITENQFAVEVVTANKEVILAAGAFQTPQLLMVSGIGPADILEAHGITVAVENPNVGQNLQDHTYFSLIVRADPATSLTPLENNVTAINEALIEWRQNHTGPATSSGQQTWGFQSLSIDELTSLNATELIDENRTNQAHIEYYFAPAMFPSNIPPGFPQTPPNASEAYMTLTAGILSPSSRGSITIQSNSVADIEPLIDLNYLNTTADQNIAVYAFKQLRNILAQPGMAQWSIGPNNGEVVPGADVQTDAEILNFIQNACLPVWHASGTAAMKPRADGGVVDPTLKVYGVSNLRIVDASIMPFVPDQHTQGPTYMIAEKAASMIKAEWGI